MYVRKRMSSEHCASECAAQQDPPTHPPTLLCRLRRMKSMLCRSSTRLNMHTITFAWMSHSSAGKDRQREGGREGGRQGQDAERGSEQYCEGLG